MVHDSFLDLEKVDKWVWKADMCLKFLVKSTYDILKGEFEGDHPQLFNSFWRIKALPLAHFVAWMVLENKISTKDNLVRREVVVERILCCFCRKKKENLFHLFFGCKFAWLVWNLCYAWLWLKSVDHLNPHSHFSHINLCNAPISINLVLGNVWIAMVSEIWCHRNKIIFNGGVVDRSNIFFLA